MKKIKIYFNEEQHKYTDEEGNVYTSTTQLIKEITHTYDTEFWSMYRALDQMGYKLRPDTVNRQISVNGKYYNLYELRAGILETVKTSNQVTKEWKEITQRSLDRGNKTHNYLEDSINNIYNEKTNTLKSNSFELSELNSNDFKYKITDLKQLENSPIKDSHVEVYNDLIGLVKAGYTLYAEKRVYSYEHKISGTIDLLAVRGKVFWIIDWKTNKDVLKFETGYYKKKWNKNRTDKVRTGTWIKTKDKFLAPLNMIPSSKGHGYALQLSIYAYICEYWGLKCKGLILFHLREDDERVYKPVKYNINYLKGAVHILMNEQLNKQNGIQSKRFNRRN